MAIVASAGPSMTAQSSRKALRTVLGDSKVERDKLDCVLHSR